MVIHPKPRPRLLLALRRALGGLLLLGAAGLFAYALVPRAEAAAPTPPRFSVAGVPARLDASPVTEAARLADAFGAREFELVLADESSRASLAELGLEVDLERLSGLLSAASDRTSALSRNLAVSAREVSLAMPLARGHARLLDTLMTLRRRFDRDSRDAHFDFDTGTLTPALQGRHLDVWATLEAVEDAARRGESRVRAVVAQSAPSVTASASAEQLVAAELGRFSTHYNGMARERTVNLRAAARRIRGTILPPGGVFDFNQVVGERSRANGFRPATVIAGGELVDGVGGGACQVAGSLHAAAFFAGLPILERHPHSRPSSYIKMGLDAAVSYPQLNLRFQNDLPFPVVLDLTVEGGLVTGRVLGRAQTRRVSFIRRVDGFDAYAEREVDDPSLPSGVRVLRQRGVPGFRVTRFRVIRDPRTNQALRQRMAQDTYPPTAQIWRRGTGPAAAEGSAPPAGDSHGEYRADEYTVMTQGEGVEGTAEVHRGGRTGTPGWTEREGMPQP